MAKDGGERWYHRQKTDDLRCAPPDSARYKLWGGGAESGARNTPREGGRIDIRVRCGPADWRFNPGRLHVGRAVVSFAIRRDRSLRMMERGQTSGGWAPATSFLAQRGRR